MHIVIAGAGAIGFHLAEVLSKENHDITLIDTDEDVLNNAGRQLDVLTILGDATAYKIQEQAKLNKAKLFIAVTTSDSTNLLAAIMAKKSGLKTIARVSNTDHLGKESAEKFREQGIDELISPKHLAAEEIQRLIERASFTDLFEFENGKISVVGFTIDGDCPLANLTVERAYEKAEDFQFRGIAILRGHTTIIPTLRTKLYKGDHFYMSTKSQSLEKAKRFIGKQQKPIKRIMILGETALALETAQILEKDYSVTIVVQSEVSGKKFINHLENSLVIVSDPSNIDALKEEGLERMDAVIALTPNAEINIIACLKAVELKIYKTIAMVDNINYIHISQNIGIDTIINKKLVAANSIIRFVRKGKVEAIASLHGVDAEIIEFEIHKKNRILRNDLSDLRLPDKSIIAGVVRGEDSFVPKLDFQFQIGDKVIILALPDVIHQLEEIFK